MAGITAASGTRNAPIWPFSFDLKMLHLYKKKKKKDPHFLSRARIGKVTRLLLSVDIRVVSQTLSSESDPNRLLPMIDSSSRYLDDHRNRSKS